MKRVQIMLSSMVVLAIVAGALAFKAKSPDVCAYGIQDPSKPLTTTCPFIARGDIQTVVAGNDELYATTLATVNNTCPTLVTVCPQNFTTEIE